MSEAEAADARQRRRRPADDETMIINMGPQHPRTHGVLRLMLELEGETVLRTQADHRLPAHRHGEDGRGAHLPAGRAPTSTRMDYASPLFNELVFSLATETLLGIEVPRAGRRGSAC